METILLILTSSLGTTVVGACITYALFQWGQKKERRRRVLYDLLRHSSDPTSKEVTAALNLLLLEFPQDREVLTRRRDFIRLRRKIPRRGPWFEDLKEAYENLLNSVQDRHHRWEVTWKRKVQDSSLHEPWIEDADTDDDLPLLAREVLLGERRLPVSVRIKRSRRQAGPQATADRIASP